MVQNPHFFYNFYVYKYATGFCSAVALVQKFRAEGRQQSKIICSYWPRAVQITPELLKRAGVDLSFPSRWWRDDLFKQLVSEFAG